MAILKAEQRANLREFFDHDKTSVFEVFMRQVQAQIRLQPTVGPGEWETISASITRQAQVDCINELLALLDEELADQEVKDAQ